MKHKTNSKFAHRDTFSSIEKFYEIMSREKKNLTKREQLDWEASYAAMCLLLPKESFLQMVDFLGGMETVKQDSNRIACLSRTFNVEDRLVVIRINDLLSQEKEEKKEHKNQNTKILNLFRKNKK